MNEFVYSFIEWYEDVNKMSRLCVSQFDLVCSDGWLVDMYQATLNVGFLVGSIAIGYLADRCVCDRLQSLV